TTAAQVSAGEVHTCMVDGSGAAWCWGENADGELGDGTTTARDLPTRVAGLPPVARISAGAFMTCAVDTGSNAWCWGNGYLGDGMVNHVSTTPLEIRAGGVADVAAYFESTCLLGTDQTVACWGNSGTGEVGNGLASAQTSPQTLSLAGVDQLTEGGRF